MDKGDIKRGILVWHRRAGKDKVCFCLLAKKAMQVAGNYFYVFPTKEMARKAVWENIDSSGFKLLNHIPKECKKRESNQEMLIELINGSTIRMIGLDKDPDAIRGVSAKGVVFSEFAFSDASAYKNMIPSLRESDGWAVFNSTPNGRNHFYNMYMNVKDSENWFCSVLQTLWSDRDNYSALIKPKAFDSIRDEEGLTQEDVEREYGCSFSSGLKGSYYSDQVERAYKENRVGNFMYNDMYRVDTFWDIGIGDDTVVWFRQKIGNNIVFIDYFEESSEDVKYYIEMLADKGYKYGTHYLPHDAGHRRHSGKGYVETTADIFRDLCTNFGISDDIEIVNKTNSIQESIYKVRARFPRMHFNEVACQEGLKKIELYHRKYDKIRQTFLQTPVHDFTSHAADALRTEADAEGLENDFFWKLNGDNAVQAITDYDLFE